MSELQRTPGRPCAVCSLVDDGRRAVEEALTGGDSFRSISATAGIGRASLRGHFQRHMEVSADALAARGLDSVTIALRLQAVAERAREVAEEALDTGSPNAVLRAGDAELRALAVLAGMGVRHESVLHQLDSMRQTMRFLNVALRSRPELREALAHEVERADYPQAAKELRAMFSETKELRE